LAILDAVDDNTKMILCSPNNPTGNSSFPMKVWLLYFKILKALWLLMKRICKKQRAEYLALCHGLLEAEGQCGHVFKQN
jgi:hypothetical protein